METRTQPSVSGIDETAALRSIVEGTATETGERFFAALVENLANLGALPPGGRMGRNSLRRPPCPASR